MTQSLPLLDLGAKVVDFAQYLAQHPRTPKPEEVVVDRTPRKVSTRAIAHRQRMLRHLASNARVGM